jgi:ketosteroid isomerase-like protein
MSTKILLRRNILRRMKRTASRWVVVALLSLSFQGFAGDPQSTWVFDSVAPSQTPSQSTSGPSEAQQVYAVILDQINYWNAHDIEHYMDTYWKSPDLLVVVEGEQIIGWGEMLAAYQRGFPDRKEMGIVTLQRVRLQQISPEFYLALSWYTFTRNTKNSYCTDTMIFRKLPEGWKIITSHASFLEP